MTTDFYGLSADTLTAPPLRLDYLTQAGPRLVRLFYGDSQENLFVEVPERSRETAYGEYRIRGGHRLWHAPEAMPRTYLPDNEGVSVERSANRVRLTGAVEAPTGMQKVIQVELHPGEGRLSLRHEIHNRGLWPVELAPWALSMMRLGGLAVFPQETMPLDESGTLPNRHLVMWPYASWLDPRLAVEDDLILIRAFPAMPPLKIGYMNRQGWIAYFAAGALLVKRFQPQPERAHVDFGCNVESFINDLFIEMEVVAPLQKVAPGASVVHEEMWEIYPAPAVPDSSQAARRILKSLGVL